MPSTPKFRLQTQHAAYLARGIAPDLGKGLESGASILGVSIRGRRLLVLRYAASAASHHARLACTPLIRPSPVQHATLAGLISSYGWIPNDPLRLGHGRPETHPPCDTTSVLSSLDNGLAFSRRVINELRMASEQRVGCRKSIASSID